MSRDWGFLAKIPPILPLIELRPKGLVLFPGVTMKMGFEYEGRDTRTGHLDAVRKVPYILIKPQLTIKQETKGGILAKVVRYDQKKDTYEIELKLMIRVLLSPLKPESEGLPQAKWSPLLDLPLPENIEKQPSFIEQLEYLETLFESFLGNRKETTGEAENQSIRKIGTILETKEPKKLAEALDGILNLISLTDFIGKDGDALNLSIPSYQMILERSVMQRLERVIVLLEVILKFTEMEDSDNEEDEEDRPAASTDNKKFSKRQGEYERIKDFLPEEARKEIEHEMSHIKKVGPFSQEKAHLERWLDFVLSLPWGKYDEGEINIREVKRILEEDHWGLEEVKKRIARYVAAHRRNPKRKGPKLGFFGPPGVGKTSLGKSIAKALGRKFVRISLGGKHDEAVIRGHRRTYIGAMQGVIAKGIRDAGSMNSLFMIDEIDKIQSSSGIQGDPEAALLEVLDPEQNVAFNDEYVGVPLDLSRVLFILTGNDYESVLPALRDRIEAIHFPAYTDSEKLEIAKRHLIPQVFEEVNFTRDKLREEGVPEIKLADDALKILTEATPEAGVRQLKSRLTEVCETIAEKIAEGFRPPEGSENGWEINAHNLPEFIAQKSLRIPKEDKDLFDLPAGNAIGLAVSGDGGTTLVVEATYRKIPRLELHLTGHLDQVHPEAQTIKDSAKVALDRLTHNGGMLENHDLKKRIGIHLGNGGVPKVGTSAGITLYIALLSMFLNKSVKKGLAMTGELYKRRKAIKAVGGIREKVMAAIKNKLTEVMLPEANQEDVEDIPAEERSKIIIHFVKTPEEAALIAFPDEPMVQEFVEKQRSL